MRNFLANAGLPLLALLIGISGCAGTKGENPPDVQGVSLQMGANTNSTLTSLRLCARTLNLIPAHAGSAIGNVVIDLGSKAIQVEPAATEFGTASVPVQSYARAELSLGTSCTSSKSVSITNETGTYEVAEPVVLSVQGPIEVNGSTPLIRFELGSLINQLVEVTSDGQLKDAVKAGLGPAVTLDGFTWLGKGSDANWNTADNWSTGTVPGPENSAVFDSHCQSNCSPLLNVTISVKGIYTNLGFNGTLTQAPGVSIQIGIVGWRQASGVFLGGNSQIKITGPLILYGGSFTSTSGLLHLNKTGELDARTLIALNASGQYFHNSGQVKIGIHPPSCLQKPYPVLIQKDWIVESLTLDGSSPCLDVTPSVGFEGTGKIVARSQLTLLNTRTNGAWETQGDLTIGPNARGGAARLFMTGSAVQTLTHLGGTIPVGAFTIDKSGGVVNITTPIALNGVSEEGTAQWLILSGTLNMQGNNLTVIGGIQNGGVINKSLGTISTPQITGSGTVNP